MAVYFTDATSNCDVHTYNQFMRDGMVVYIPMAADQYQPTLEFDAPSTYVSVAHAYTCLSAQEHTILALGTVSPYS